MSDEKLPCRTVVRYRESPEFRERHKGLMRRKYRQRVGLKNDHSIPSGDAERFGTVRELEGTGKRVLTFNTQETAAALGLPNAGVITRWLSDSQLPQRIYPAVSEYVGRGGKPRTTTVYVYLLEEINAIREVLAKHYEVTRYFRRDHTRTINEIATKIEAVRR